MTEIEKGETEADPEIETGTEGGKYQQIFSRSHILTKIDPDQEIVIVTVTVIVRRPQREGSLHCTGMFHLQGLNTSLPCSTRACSRVAR